MPTLSRHLPKAEDFSITKLFLLIIIVICIALCAAYIRLMIDIPFFVVVPFCVIVWGLISSRREKRHFANLIENRAGDSICSFRREFEVRRVDPWIIRATYQEIQKYLSGHVKGFPVRADDRFIEDLKLDSEDLEDIVEAVATRAGYDWRELESNPLMGKVITVRDLVLFIAHQKCPRKSNPKHA